MLELKFCISNIIIIRATGNQQNSGCLASLCKGKRWEWLGLWKREILF